MALQLLIENTSLPTNCIIELVQKNVVICIKNNCHLVHWTALTIQIVTLSSYFSPEMQ